MKNRNDIVCNNYFNNIAMIILIILNDTIDIDNIMMILK